MMTTLPPLRTTVRGAVPALHVNVADVDAERFGDP
jgi:hypothetical protein